MNTAEELELFDWEEENPAEIKGFAIDTDSKADWALRKVTEIDRECERMNAVRRERIETLQRAIEREEQRRDERKAGLMGMLEMYFELCDTKETKTQYTYKLPSGKLIVKKPSAKPEHDDVKIMEFLRENGYDGYTETKETLKWGELKKRLTFEGGTALFADTGEVVPGVTVTYSKPEFTAKPEGGNG